MGAKDAANSAKQRPEHRPGSDVVLLPNPSLLLEAWVTPVLLFSISLLDYDRPTPSNRDD